MIEVEACGVDEIFAHPSFAALVAEAAAECANRELTAPSPDRALYRVLEASGSALCFRVGCGDELYGFALVLLAPSAHNGKRYATVESLFVGKQFRRTGAWTLLEASIADATRARGCETYFLSAHVGTRLAKLMFMDADRYALTNFVFMRRLN